MILDDKTSELKWLAKSIKLNFLKIGQLLLTIRDNELFKEKYGSFNQYLESNDFEFSKGHAYKIMKVVADPKLVALCDTYSVTTLIQLTYITDKEKRDSIITEAEENLDDFSKTLKRTTQRQDSDLEIKTDSKRDKCVRQFNMLIQDIQMLKGIINNMKKRISGVILFSGQFENSGVSNLKTALKQAWEDCLK